MPELAEVENVRLNLEAWWQGRRAVEIDEGLDEGLLVETTLDRVRGVLLGARCLDVRRRGKVLAVELQGGEVLAFHFMMTGKIVRRPRPEARHSRMAWRIDGDGWLHFVDPRRLGSLRCMSVEALERWEGWAGLGPEADEVDAEELAGRLSGTKRRLKDALLDQRVIAGVGNIAVSELFWRAGLPPEVRCDELTWEQIAALAAELPRYFSWLLQAQRSDEIRYLGEGAGTDDPFEVYGRQGQPCPRCREAIVRIRSGGRSTYYCPRCQRA